MPWWGWLLTGVVVGGVAGLVIGWAGTAFYIGKGMFG